MIDKKLAKRVRQVLISPEIFGQFVVNGSEIPARAIKVESEIPEDAVFLRGAYDCQRDLFVLLYAHPDWDEVEKGQLPPYEQVVLHTQQ
jgi:hypothetical protein